MSDGNHTGSGAAGTASRRLLCLLALVLASLPGSPGAIGAPRSGAKSGARLIDDFEKLWPWANESADDHAVLRITDEKATSGRKSLRVDFEAFGREKFQIRRDGYLDLSKGVRLLVDVYNTASRMRMAVGLETGRPPKYFESGRVTIEPGWNRNVSVTLTSSNFSLGDEEYRHGPTYLDNVLKLSLIFYEDGNAKGSVYVDSLRLAGAEAAAAEVASAPVVRAFRINGKTVDLYGQIEVEADLSGTYREYFSRQEIDVWASFYSPTGTKHIIHGFFDGLRPDRSPPRPVWKVRFAPAEPGSWIYRVGARTRFGQTESKLGHFRVRRSSEAKGFIRVSKKDPRYFEFDSGHFFYPVGQNVAWASNMEHYFDAIASYGGNVARVWLCPWHLPLELKQEAGRYDIGVARQLDAIMSLAKTYEVRVILVLNYHGILRGTWGQNPYNANNGGPCRRSHEFFTNAKAIEFAKRRIDYLCARVASSTHLFAWELFNEVNYTTYRRFEDVIEWHRRIGEHLRKADPYDHLVTTSAGSWTWRPKLLGLSSIDFLSPHIYSPDLGSAVDRISSHAEALRKPLFLGEFAGYPHAVDVRSDRKGVHLHAGLWYTFTTPWAGSALPWWWDTHIDADNLYYHLAALAKIAKGEDRRGHNFRVVETRIATGQGRQANVRGILAPSLAYVWIFDAAYMKDPTLTVDPVVPEESTFKLVGMKDGLYAVETWDTWTGKRLTRAQVRAANGRIRLTIPPSQSDLLAKVKLIAGRPAGVKGNVK